MALNVIDRTISRVHLIDDDPNVRQGYKDAVEDMGVEAVEIADAILDVDALISRLNKSTDGVVCDYQLTSKRYSPVNGDIIGSKLYRAGIPFILCTHYQPLASLVGPKRRDIPVVVTPGELSQARVSEAFALCILEERGRFSFSREPVRTLVRIEGIEVNDKEAHLRVEVPAWRPSIGIQFTVPIEQIPDWEGIRELVEQEGAARLSAEVNTGAEHLQDLFFLNWRQL